MPEPNAEKWIHRGTREFRDTNLALFAAGVATFGLIYCIQPLMPAFSAEYGVSAAVSALSLSLTTIVLAVGLLFAGALSDRFGRKPVMVASILSSALIVLASAFAPGWTSYLVARTVLGLTVSGLPAVAMTYLSEEMDAESIGLAMGLYISGNAIGGLGGRVVAGVVAEYAGWQGGVAAVGVVGLVAGVIFWRSLPASRHFTPGGAAFGELMRRYAVPFRDRGLPWLFIEGFLLLGAFVTVYNFLGYRLMAPPFNLSQAAVGLIFGIYVVGMFSSAWMGDLAGRHGRRRVFWTAVALMLAGIALTLSTSLALIFVGLGLVTFGFFGGHSIASSWVGRRAQATKAQASALYLFTYYVGSSLCGAVGGLFYATDGWAGVAAFVGVLLVLALAIALGLRRLQPLPGNAAH
ncbi:MAG: MFS transporter [Nevskiaceae bacterium]|nr:MAG: MFS transporter [Nevskiaceae bacterium]TBR72270.1 MAG: MFS transporter [Nevskiaceae bacterium]